MKTANDTTDPLKTRAQKLALVGLIARWDQVRQEPWLPKLLEYEETERGQRSLARRGKTAKLGSFKPITDFDWQWPKEIDRQLVEELFGLNFIHDSSNIIIIGQNGTGKTMLAKNLAEHAITRGYSALFISASELLNDLAAQETGSALTRRLRHYCRPQLLVIDEIGYLATSSEHADLLFEIVTRRYLQKPIILTTNKSPIEWGEVFPNAACVVALVDRLVHKAEVVKINAESYRLKEAEERASVRRTTRKSRKAAA